MKKILDDLAKKYETENFIKHDPIQFPHCYKEKEDIEIAGFISSLFAFGRRDVFIKKLKELFLLSDSPQSLIYDYKKYNLSEFVYRFIKSEDLIDVLRILNKLYITDKSGLEELFYDKKNRFLKVNEYFYKNSNRKNSRGFCFMFAKPQNGSAMKRMNMYLRWMVRDGVVDFGIWKNIKKSELFIPLDTHVARISRQMGLLERKTNDFKAALELTEKLKEYDNSDPVKYDFSLFGYGIEHPVK